MPDSIIALQWAVQPATADRLSELLAGFALQPSVWHHVQEPCAVLSLYFESPEEAEACCRQLSPALAEWQELFEEPLPEARSSVLAREDWAESWKRYFKPRRVSNHVIVRPSWEALPESRLGDVEVQIDPGMCFGTGQHGTTVACIRFLDQVVETHAGQPVLDAGCGSGIIAIAAAKLGLAPVFAFDIDEHAVTVTRENCAINGVAHLVTAESIDLTEWTSHRQWQIVVANILAEVLIAQAERLAAAVVQDQAARLILSGILHGQFPAVRERYKSLGFDLSATEVIDEWTSGLFIRR